MISILKNTYKIDFKAYNVGEFDTPLDKLSQPFFFVIYPDLSCHSFFAATKENPSLTMIYLTTMKEKLENNLKK